MTTIGVEKTLIIACGNYAMQDYSQLSDDVIFYRLPEKMLQQFDSRERERLRDVIEASGCRQLILLGALDETMYSRLNHESAFHSLRKGLCFNTKLLPNGNQPLSGPLRFRALLEHHIASQCAQLMDYHFIKRNVAKRLLSVRGVVGTPYREDHKTVFLNGVRCNDLIAMN